MDFKLQCSVVVKTSKLAYNTTFRMSLNMKSLSGSEARIIISVQTDMIEIKAHRKCMFGSPNSSSSLFGICEDCKKTMEYILNCKMVRDYPIDISPNQSIYVNKSYVKVWGSILDRITDILEGGIKLSDIEYS